MRILWILWLLVSGLIAATQVHSQPASTDAASEREELAVAALEGLLAAPSQRALPLIQKVLDSNHSERVKSRALFVLSQIDLPEAQTVLIDFAHSAKPALKAAAIRMIGINGKADSLAVLGEIYAHGDGKIRQQVLEAYMIAGDTQAVYNIAQNAQSDEEFEAAAKMLGVMGATTELRQLVRNGNSTESVVHAYAISGDLEGLMELAQNAATAGNPELLVSAISNIGIIGGEHANQALMDFYRDSNDLNVKQAALQGLMVSGHDVGLLELYRNAHKLDEKRQLLRMLSTTGSDAALEAIDAALDGNQP